MQKVHLLWHIIYSWKEPLLIETDMIVPWDIAESDLFFKVMKARAREGGGEYLCIAPCCRRAIAPSSWPCLFNPMHFANSQLHWPPTAAAAPPHLHTRTSYNCCCLLFWHILYLFLPKQPEFIPKHVCMWILPLFPPKMAKNWKGARFWQSRAARVVKSAIRNNKAHACRCALVWAVGPSAGGKSVVVEGVAVHFCTKFALADGMHCNFRPSENSATSPTALATLSLALACHALARRAQWLVNFCKYIHISYICKIIHSIVSES